MSEKFKVLVADPPWKFGDKLPGPNRGAESNYSCLTVKELCEFPIPEMQPDSWLFLWRVSAMPEEALQVVRAWGFVPKTELIWAKRTKNGKRWFGMGHQVRAEHETCIIATRGSPKVLNRNTRSIFEAAYTGHSRKPDEFYELVEKLCPGPIAELFARRPRDGWTTFGNQLPADQGFMSAPGVPLPDSQDYDYEEGELDCE